MAELTHRQRSALEHLIDLHERYPNFDSFCTAHLGTHNAQLLRRISDSGLVIISRGGRGSRQWFKATVRRAKEK